MAIKIEMLRAFAIVAQTGNLAEAANRLGRTPSAVSMTLKSLEDHLGQRLFETDRKNRLTPLGDYVLEQAQNELRQFDATLRAIEAYASSPKGLLRVAAVPSVAGVVFAPVLEDFTARHPGVSVEIRDMDSLNILDALTRGQIDIGIAAGNGPMRGVVGEPLFADAFGVICGRGHPLANAPGPLHLADLAGHRVLGNDLSARIADPGLQAAMGGRRISAQNTLSLIALVRSGGWVTVLPKAVRRMAPDDLVFRAFADLEEHRRVDLLIREDRMAQVIVADFAEALRQFDWRL
jgi:LysR family transcriptional regulator, carnitine catabolism transcriptional activator